MTTTLIFRTGPDAPRGGERDLAAELPAGVELTPEVVLGLVRGHMAHNEWCRVSALDVTPARGSEPGRLEPRGAWRIRRFKHPHDIPTPPAWLESMPGSYGDIVDDMSVKINLPDWVAVFVEPLPEKKLQGQ